jgi:hypothetical protein
MLKNNSREHKFYDILFIFNKRIIFMENLDKFL